MSENPLVALRKKNLAQMRQTSMADYEENKDSKIASTIASKQSTAQPHEQVNTTASNQIEEQISTNAVEPQSIQDNKPDIVVATSEPATQKRPRVARRTATQHKDLSLGAPTMPKEEPMSNSSSLAEALAQKARKTTAKVQIGTYLPADLAEKLDQYCRMSGVKKSDAVELAIEHMLKAVGN